MRAVVIEDEKAAVRNLTNLLWEETPHIRVIEVLDSIAESVEWFKSHEMPDLVFLDIHLADGSSFEIFKHVDITCPIIFTTAYDEYAVRAFKVNSIDYLLKPIGFGEIREAIGKLGRLQTGAPAKEIDYESLATAIKQQETFQKNFLLPVKGDKLRPVSADTILYFYITDGVVKGVTTEGQEYVFPQTLEELAECLDPQFFFRINRQYLLARQAIYDIDLWFNGRLSINLPIPQKEKILVSKARVNEFKDWLIGLYI